MVSKVASSGTTMFADVAGGLQNVQTPGQQCDYAALRCALHHITYAYAIWLKILNYTEKCNFVTTTNCFFLNFDYYFGLNFQL